jgi:S-adenosylmethionine:tRNA ribosyltransferase-isomerase
MKLAGQAEARGIAIASVTLHVGAGTFQPVTETLPTTMHFERFEATDATHR